MWQISHAAYATVRRGGENLEQGAVNKAVHSLPFVYSAALSCPALSKGLISARQSHYRLNDHVIKVGLKNVGDYKVIMICINKMRLDLDHGVIFYVGLKKKK